MMNPRSFGRYRFVPYARLPDMLAMGWMPAADLGPVHGFYSLLMWRCDCAGGGA